MKKIEKKKIHETVKKKITEFFKRKNEDVEELGLSEAANATNNHQKSLKTLNNF